MPRRPSRKSSSAPKTSTAKSGRPAGRKRGQAARMPKAAQQAAVEDLAAAMPHNPVKAAEFGKRSRRPPAGPSVAADPAATASTRSAGQGTAKTGGGADPGQAPGGSLDRARTDATGQALTTNQGVPIADNQNSLKAGLRGPTLLEDFILREKITHFDHERIPERIVHARGSGAHGHFECYRPLTDLTRASLFAAARKRTPVFVRFSTVAGERGSTDTARDVRGFAVKFYTDEGNFDLVGNNIPVFFIQDAMKFPDLVHALKPEPHHGMPQAASAHDTFWDFVSLMPESTHMLLWLMSDRAIPRSFRMMQGFGVHTFRFVNAGGRARFVKFHWLPAAGTHSLVWDEAVRISGADPDFHRRDLWEAIEAGHGPEWELAIQVFDDRQAEAFSFDVLDATKLVPEELVPLQPIGRMVLDRNPDNFFAETEQAAFCAAHVLPGIDFSNDPLLAGRIHSYVDTQISRLGGANFHEIPINAPLAPVHNHQRDGMHRQAIARGRVAYEPNSLGGGDPHQAGPGGFQSFAEPVAEDKVRGKPERFAEHYRQATLFYESQSDAEKRHIAAAFRFELSKVQVAAIRERMVAGLRNVSEELAGAVADGLGLAELPEPLPRALARPPRAEVTHSPALSLLARPGRGGIATRRIAILVADGTDGQAAAELRQRLQEAAAEPRYVGLRLGRVQNGTGRLPLPVDDSLETAPSVTWDAMVVPGGAAAVGVLARSAQALDFLAEQYRHCKAILLLDEAEALLEAAGIPRALPSGAEDPGLLLGQGGGIRRWAKAFVAAVAAHRHFQRESDPPLV